MEGIIRDPSQVVQQTFYQHLGTVLQDIEVWKSNACFMGHGGGTPAIVNILSWMYVRYVLWPALDYPEFNLYFPEPFQFYMDTDHKLQVQTEFSASLKTLVEESKAQFTVVPFDTSTLTHDWKGSVHHVVVLLDKEKKRGYVIDAAGPTPFAQGIVGEVEYLFPDYTVAVFPSRDFQLSDPHDEGCVAWGFWLALNFLIKAQTGTNCVEQLDRDTDLRGLVRKFTSAVGKVLGECLEGLRAINFTPKKLSFARQMKGEKPDYTIDSARATRIAEILASCPPNRQLLKWIQCPASPVSPVSSAFSTSPVRGKRKSSTPK
jgi:hypothetical protein